MLNDIAVIAGSGKLPIKIATFLKKKNARFLVLCIKGFANFEDYKKYNSFSLRMGEGLKAINILKKNKIKKLIFLGALERPSLLDLRPDVWTLFKVFNFIFFKKTDDIILRNVAAIFESEGFKVIGLSDITDKFFLKKGIYGNKKISNQDLLIIKSRLKETLHWTKKDLGQSVITSKRRIILKEDRKGTNNLIIRSNNKKYAKNRYLFIKLKKLNQDTRVDLPAFGFETLKKLIKTNIKYIILNADSTVIMDKEKVLDFLSKKNKTILSVNIKNSTFKKFKFEYE